MDDKEIFPAPDDGDEGEFTEKYYTLTDEEGVAYEFELVGNAVIDGQRYLALAPADADDNEDEFVDYTILKVTKDENGENVFSTVDDDDEYEDVADYFDNAFETDIDYDAKPKETPDDDSKPTDKPEPEAKKTKKPATDTKSKPKSNSAPKKPGKTGNGGNPGKPPVKK